MKKVFFILAILFSFSIVLPVMAETWTDPTCDPPDCNTDGPVWVNPGSSQSGFIDLSYDETDDVPVLQIIDTRASGAPEASFYVNSAVNDKSAIYGYSTGTGTAYGGQFSASNNAGILISGGIKFTGLTDLNEPTYIDNGLLYYNTDSNLFKFYNGSQWVDLDNQWTTNGDEIYRSFASSAVSQGVGIKSGDNTNPNDDYNLDIYRKALTVDDKGVYSRLEMIAPSSLYVSGALAVYDSSGNAVGVTGKAGLVANGIGGYFSSESNWGTGIFVEATGNSGASVSNVAGQFEVAGDQGKAVVGLATSTGGSGHVNYGGYFTAAGDDAIALYAAGPATPTTTALALKLDRGAMAMQELGTLPTNVANYGNVYVKSSDSLLYFQDDGGTEYDLTTGGVGTIEDGTADGQVAYWDNTAGEWKYTDTSEMVWLDDEKSLSIGYAFNSNSGIKVVNDKTGSDVYGLTASTSVTGAYTNYGIYAGANGDTGRGVYGIGAALGAHTNYGGYFVAQGDMGLAVYGYASATGGVNYGGSFLAKGLSARAVYGEADNTGTGTSYGGYFSAATSSGVGVYGVASGATSKAIYGYASNTGASVGNIAGDFLTSGGSGTAVRGVADSSSTTVGVIHYGGYFTSNAGYGKGLYASGALESARFEGAEVVISNGAPSTQNFATAAGELYVEYDIEADGNIYADIFYDNSSTYYVDPSSSTSARLEGNIQIGYGSNADDDYIYFDNNDESMKWDNAATRFEFTDEVYATSFRSSYGYLTYGYMTNLYTTGIISATDAASNPMYVNRTSTDGNLIRFDNDGVFAGTISVSGTTVSYNAFTGSHYVLPEEKMERGQLVELTGKNEVLADSEYSEPLYGVKLSTKANSPAIIGSFLSESNDGEEFSLAQAVGNGEMWIVDNGEDLEIGDYLISSDLKGHAMKVSNEFAEANVVARLAENVDWKNVEEKTINGVKHKLVSVFFESFVMKNNDKKIEEQQKEIDELKKQVEYLMENIK